MRKRKQGSQGRRREPRKPKKTPEEPSTRVVIRHLIKGFRIQGLERENPELRRDLINYELTMHCLERLDITSTQKRLAKKLVVNHLLFDSAHLRASRRGLLRAGTIRKVLKTYIILKERELMGLKRRYGRKASKKEFEFWKREKKKIYSFMRELPKPSGTEVPVERMVWDFLNTGIVLNSMEFGRVLGELKETQFWQNYRNAKEILEEELHLLGY